MFYRPEKEFKFIFDNCLGGPTATIGFGMFKARIDDPTEPIRGINVRRREDCLFVVDSVFGSLTGKSYNRLPVSVNDSVNENIKIRKHNKLGADRIEDSVAAHDAKYKSEEDKKFDQEVEDAQKKAGVVGCLDQQAQEESVKIHKSADAVNETPSEFKLVLPNKARYSKVEEGFDVDKMKIERGPKTRTDVSPIDKRPWPGDALIYEPHDKIIFRIQQQYGPDAKKDVEWAEYRGVVTDAIDDIENGQLVTILCQGHTLVLTPIDIRPDYGVIVQSNRFVDAPDDPRLASREGMGINPETRLTDTVENDPTDYRQQYHDFNNERNHFTAYLVQDDTVIMAPLTFSAKDVSESKRVLRAMNEEMELLTDVPVEEIAVPEENWPWAVIVDGNADDTAAEDEPLRKIRVNPVSYIEADEESDGDSGLVEIILGDTKTKMMKRNIRILS